MKTLEIIIEIITEIIKIKDFIAKNFIMLKKMKKEDL